MQTHAMAGFPPGSVQSWMGKTSRGQSGGAGGARALKLSACTWAAYWGPAVPAAASWLLHSRLLAGKHHCCASPAHSTHLSASGCRHAFLISLRAVVQGQEGRGLRIAHCMDACSEAGRGCPCPTGDARHKGCHWEHAVQQQPHVPLPSDMKQQSPPATQPTQLPNKPAASDSSAASLTPRAVRCATRALTAPPPS